MMKKVYAHSIDGQPPEKWQPLEDHLKQVAEKAAAFAEIFKSAEWAYNAGWLHDLGKATNAFQNYLLRSNELDDSGYDNDGTVSNHASAGAALAEEKLGPCIGRILAYLSAGHHAGLPDWYPADTGNAALSVRLVEGRENLKRIQQYADEIFPKLKQKTAPPPYLDKKPENFHLWARMLFSCLVDADYLDTEEFRRKGQEAKRGKFENIEGLRTLYDAYMTDMRARTKETKVNSIRQEILAACRKAAENTPGLFSLTVPTGGGKTLSSMAFALDHAVKHGKSRIIYVIPYTSIIEQTAKILADIFGRDNVVEHHSNLEPSKETQRASLAAENWDAPIIVTTNVQFFESLYAAKSGRCRKLHNIVNSVVILDEAQLLPPNLLTPCVDAMNQLVNNYGVTILLATATQPALPGLAKPTEIVEDTKDIYDRLKRTEIRIPQDLDERISWEDLAKRLQAHQQVLCVVNTRRDCYDLYKLMPEGTIHLSALMCGRHRSAVIRLIKCKLGKGMPIRVISTQLVEAGVDIDFPIVYRAFAGLSSIAQAAGRCNREGKLNDEGRMGQVHVFVPPKASPPGVLLKAENTTRQQCVLLDFDPLKPSEYSRFFELFYKMLNDTGSRYHEWLVKDVNPNLYFHFRTAANEFKMIDDQAQRPVIVRYGDSDKWIGQLRQIGPTRETMRHLQRYTVNLPVRMVDKMLSDRTLERIDHAKARDIIVQSCLRLYNKNVGLDVYSENLPVEDLYI
ncbi:CRISPR-associated helicase Cas3' [candidate division TA06 bacterium]|uniref:CRISPR-associated helicase Cas3 n=1 Tax=candidate division TA06 bacterium TaxID=2250710 RepID=A0A933IAJ5_UNCT6|nr:CRISPR-associated helicase Cas3' [candidate division TA06 bacterium]